MGAGAGASGSADGGGSGIGEPDEHAANGNMKSSVKNTRGMPRYRGVIMAPFNS